MHDRKAFTPWEQFFWAKEHVNLCSKRLEVTPIPLCARLVSHFSHVWLCAALWTVAHQAPLYMGFSSSSSSTQNYQWYKAWWIILPSIKPAEVHLNVEAVLVSQSCLTLEIPSPVTCQASLSIEFSNQESWTG